jgi:hypothetical protein
VLSLTFATGAFAADEIGDAGDLRVTANDMGDSAVTQINGSFTDATDSDVYRLCLSDGASFSASSVGQTFPPNLDTQLFLFDSQGYGIYANDDAAGGIRGSTLPAQHRFSPSAGGEYFLAISQYNRDPQSSQGEIFQDNFSRWLYPDGVLPANGFGGGETLSGWNGRAPGGMGTYRITLTGTASCVPPDTTPPTVDLRPVDGERVRQGAEVVVDFSCADEGSSGLDSCVGTTADGELLDTSALGDVSVTVTARDHAGNETVVTHTVTVVDETDPEVTIDTPQDGAVYARGEHVTADYSCADEPNGSGIESCVGDVPGGDELDTSTLGEHSFTVQATDRAGNTGSQTVNYRVVDTTAPGIVVTTPASGAVYGLGEHVVADYACADEAGGSGLDTCEGTVADGAAVDTSSVGEKTFTVEATDNAGNPASKSVKYTVVDTAGPGIVVTTPASGAVYGLGEHVAADYACTDEAGGSGLASCAGTVAKGAAVDTSSVGEKTFTVEATDNAGNSSSKSVKYTVVDQAPPSISVASPTEGAVYALGQRVLASYACEDQPGGSGVASCSGTAANGAPIDTKSFGQHTFEVTSTDHAGNRATKVVTYSVAYNFDGFLWPVKNPPKVNKWKAGVPVPIRFSLNGFSGPKPEADGYPRSTRCGGGDTEMIARAAKKKNKKPVFTYVKRSDQYVMLWKTDKKWAGSCREFVLMLDDGSVHTAQFQFKKKHDRD